jgi:tRNA(Ile)-lysidine synthase
MLDQIQSALERHAMVRRDDLVLVAVSGGADSVALLHALWQLREQLGIRLAIAHLNHGIRGAAADADAAFVCRLAQRLKLPLVEERADVPQQARAAGVSLEMAARAARYAFFQRAAFKLGAAAVAVAHNADDQAETILLRIARGTGPDGLAGMSPVSQRDGLKIVRPLLGVTRADIVAYLKQQRLRWREDVSNRDPHHLRNRVRHEILPLLERRLNPQIRTALLRMAEVMRDENEDNDLVAQTMVLYGHLSVKQLLAFGRARQRRILRQWLFAGRVEIDRVSFDAVESILPLLADQRGTKFLDLGGGWKVVRRYNELSLERSPEAATPRWKLDIKKQRGIIKEKPTTPGHLPACATLNAAAVRGFPLLVRAARPGDRMAPLGMEGTKKLQDIFTDAKVPRDQRDRIPVVECRGQIVWLPGYRVARGWEVPNPQSRSLRLTLRAG